MPDEAALKEQLKKRLLELMRGSDGGGGSEGGDGDGGDEAIDQAIEQFLSAAIEEIIDGYDGDLSGVPEEEIMALVGSALEQSINDIPD